MNSRNQQVRYQTNSVRQPFVNHAGILADFSKVYSKEVFDSICSLVALTFNWIPVELNVSTYTDECTNVHINMYTKVYTNVSTSTSITAIKVASMFCNAFRVEKLTADEASDGFG